MKKQKRTSGSNGESLETTRETQADERGETSSGRSMNTRSGESAVMQIHDLLEEADAFIGDLETQAIETIRTLRRQVSFGISTARSALDAFGEGSLTGARNAMRGAGSYVKDHPWQTAAGVLAIGLTTALISRVATDEGGRPSQTH